MCKVTRGKILKKGKFRNEVFNLASEFNMIYSFSPRRKNKGVNSSYFDKKHIESRYVGKLEEENNQLFLWKKLLNNDRKQSNSKNLNLSEIPSINLKSLAINRFPKKNETILCLISFFPLLQRFERININNPANHLADQNFFTRIFILFNIRTSKNIEYLRIGSRSITLKLSFQGKKFHFCLNQDIFKGLFILEEKKIWKLKIESLLLSFKKLNWKIISKKYKNRIYKGKKLFLCSPFCFFEYGKVKTLIFYLKDNSPKRPKEKAPTTIRINRDGRLNYINFLATILWDKHFEPLSQKKKKEYKNFIFHSVSNNFTAKTCFQLFKPPYSMGKYNGFETHSFYPSGKVKFSLLSHNISCFFLNFIYPPIKFFAFTVTALESSENLRINGKGKNIFLKGKSIFRKGGVYQNKTIFKRLRKNQNQYFSIRKVWFSTLKKKDEVFNEDLIFSRISKVKTKIFISNILKAK